MAKRKPVFKMISYGEYSEWDRESIAIPRILNISTRIEAEIGTEFGYVLHITGGKGETVSFRIEHPPFKNDDGKISPPFEGEQFIRTNDFLFYLGDCVWEPLDDKLGNWELFTFYKGKTIARKLFELVRK